MKHQSSKPPVGAAKSIWTLLQVMTHAITLLAMPAIADAATFPRQSYRFYQQPLPNSAQETLFVDLSVGVELLDAFDFGPATDAAYADYPEHQDDIATGVVYASTSGKTYWVGVESNQGSLGLNGVSLQQHTKHRKCDRSATMSLKITELRLIAYDAGNRFDYDGDAEGEHVPELFARGEMEVVVISTDNQRVFFNTGGAASLWRYVSPAATEPWKASAYDITSSVSDFWKNANLVFEEQLGGVFNNPGERVGTYRLNSPHTIRLELNDIPVSPNCGSASGNASGNDPGEYFVVVTMKAEAATAFTASDVELSAASVFFKDPQDTGQNDTGIVFESEGVEDISTGPEPDPTAPPPVGLLPDPNCVRP